MHNVRNEFTPLIGARARARFLEFQLFATVRTSLELDETCVIDYSFVFVAIYFFIFDVPFAKRKVLRYRMEISSRFHAF